MGVNQTTTACETARDPAAEPLSLLERGCKRGNHGPSVHEDGSFCSGLDVGPSVEHVGLLWCFRSERFLKPEDGPCSRSSNLPAHRPEIHDEHHWRGARNGCAYVWRCPGIPEPNDATPTAAHLRTLDELNRLRATLEEVAGEWEHPAEVYALRMSAAPRLRALLGQGKDGTAQG